MENEPRHLGLQHAQIRHGAFGAECRTQPHVLKIDDKPSQPQGAIERRLGIRRSLLRIRHCRARRRNGRSRSHGRRQFELTEDHLRSVQRLADLENRRAGKNGVGTDRKTMIDLHAILARGQEQAFG